MIARIWTARTTPDQAPGYAEHLQARVLPQLRRLAGYSGATLLRGDAGGETEIIVITRWRSFEAVRAFAGTDIEVAVVEDEAAVVLSQYDKRVKHYEIVVEEV